VARLPLRRSRIERERHPDLAIPPDERGRHDAEDFSAHAFEKQPAADGLRVAAEPVFPEPVADHRHWRRAGLVVGLAEDAAEQRFDAQHGKGAGGDARAADAIWMTAFDEVDVSLDTREQ